MSTLSFRELVVWQKSMDLARYVYTIGKLLPNEEKFGLAGQMQRCAVSIPSNLAEGNKRGTRKEYAQFLRVAGGSAAELETKLLLARDMYAVNITKQLALLDEVQKMLESMKRKLLQPIT